MANITLNQSKKLFLASSCFKEQKMLDYVLKSLKKQNFPEKNILRNISADMINSGDYLVRCLDNAAHLFEIQLTLPFGFTTNLLGKL